MPRPSQLASAPGGTQAAARCSGHRKVPLLVGPAPAATARSPARQPGGCRHARKARVLLRRRASRCVCRRAGVAPASTRSGGSTNSCTDASGTAAGTRRRPARRLRAPLRGGSARPAMAGLGDRDCRPRAVLRVHRVTAKRPVGQDRPRSGRQGLSGSSADRSARAAAWAAISSTARFQDGTAVARADVRSTGTPASASSAIRMSQSRASPCQ